MALCGVYCGMSDGACHEVYRMTYPHQWKRKHSCPRVPHERNVSHGWHHGSQCAEIHGALWKEYVIRMCALMGVYTTSLRLVSVYLSSTAAGLPCLQVGGAFVGGRPFSGGSGSIARKRVTPPPPLCSFAVLRFSAVRFLPCETAPARLGTRAQRQEITPGVFFTLRGTAVLLRRRVAQAQR